MNTSRPNLPARSLLVSLLVLTPGLTTEAVPVSQVLLQDRPALHASSAAAQEDGLPLSISLPLFLVGLGAALVSAQRRPPIVKPQAEDRGSAAAD